ncbi:hypothetical protein P3L51_24465 [Streptomyces sp. PSRA5]|uniref:hypothetical protein n=1 Tax=Streptomyces panacea TaxID=3035064 RepID=UPI00339CDBDD
MARIRILTAIGGLGFSWRPGELVDLDETEAAKWADGVRAEYAEPPPPPPPGGSAPPPAPDGNDQEPFDPSAHTIPDVLAYLDTVGESEALRVYELEEAGENRAGISKQKDRVLERAHARDAEHAATGPSEVAADTSRGGGRGDGALETRDQ